MELTILILKRFNFNDVSDPVKQIIYSYCFISLTQTFYLEQLELLIATLIDLDAMDGKSSVSLLVECSSSPDVNTR